MAHAYPIAIAMLLLLAGCGSSTTWKDAKGEPAAAEEMRACRSQAGLGGPDPRVRGGLSLATPGSIDDYMLADNRFAEEQRQRQRPPGQCMRRLGYRAQ